MSQYYPPQGPPAPPEPPGYPPPHNPESDYEYYDDAEYEEIDDRSTGSMLQIALAFLGGGCLVFVCMSACALGLAGLWILDPGAGTPTPPPGSELGLTFDDPAFPGESVVNEEFMKLSILDVNRNAAVDTIPPVEGREVVVITIELVNIGEEEREYSERDFALLNVAEEAYMPTLGAIDGSLGRGILPPGQGLEGRLVFEVVQDEFDLQLLWEPGRDTQARYIYIQ